MKDGSLESALTEFEAHDGDFGFLSKLLATDLQRDCSRMIAYDAKLDAIRADKIEIQSGEPSWLVARLLTIRGHWQDAVRFFRKSGFENRWRSDDGRESLAPRAAVQASLELADPDESKKLRAIALEWLRSHFAYAQRQTNARKRNAMLVMVEHPQLEAVRGTEQLMKLDEPERSVWQEFWHNVRMLVVDKGRK